MGYWIGVASRDHVLVAVRGGFAPFGHGKLAPAKRPAKGDCIIYYSGKEKFGEPSSCQRFVAIGQFLDAGPTKVTQQSDLAILDERFGALDPATLGQCMSTALAEAKTLPVIAHP